MIQIPGYQITEKLYESETVLIVRAIEITPHRKTVLKILKKEYPGPREIASFKREFDIGVKLKAEGVIEMYGLKKVKNGFMIVMEDFGGVSLDTILSIEKPSLLKTLDLAVRMADALGQIHIRHIIHKDLNPSNILWNPTSGQLKIIDFGLSSELPKETQEILHPTMLEGALSYMSPEQTGRMNRSTDHRSDLYALGVILYEMTTGSLPFQANTPMALVHCHIARPPVPPSEQDPKIPSVLSDIILKLLSKNAEERYQSAAGLKFDLLLCLEHLKSSGTISPFQIGKKDVSDTFRIPQTLYGRQEEIQTLLRVFDDVCRGGKALLTMQGLPGIGKSSIVHEIQKNVVAHHGFFISGKFDQLERDIPYRALTQAFRKMIGQILTENDLQTAFWKESLHEALGQNGPMISEIIPELKMLIDVPESFKPLSPVESQNRFNLVFQNFIGVFARKDHPLVLFLDDLQWADAASLKLIESVMGNAALTHLFIVAAYRENEVTPGHPVHLTLDTIRKSGKTIRTIQVNPLSLPDITKLLTDTLITDSDQVQPLANAVYRLTQGNPFFTNQLLQALYDQGVLFYNATRGEWQWEIGKIDQRATSSDVIDLMTEKITRLPEKTIDILKLAACIGNCFELKMIAIVCRKPPAETALALWPAMREGLILPIGEEYKLIHEMEGVSKDEKQSIWETVSYQFLHDRVQQAAYLLIPENLKKETHLTIGRLLLKDLDRDERHDKLFDIVNQMKYALDLLDDDGEKFLVAKLNLQAGKRAMSANAYDSAMNYLNHGRFLLREASWEEAYDLLIELHIEAANAAYLSGDFSEMEKIAETGIMKAHHLHDAIPFYETRMQACFSRNKPFEGLTEGLAILKKLGYRFPDHPTRFHAIIALAQLKWMMKGRRIHDLYDVPDMVDQNVACVCRILPHIGNAVYRTVPELLPLVVFLGVKLFLKYGNAAETAFFIASYGMILSSVVKKPDTGFKFGELAFSLKERAVGERFKARTWYLIEGFIRHWKRHIRESLDPLAESYRLGMASGDLEFGTGAAHLYCAHSYFAGKPLQSILPEVVEYSRMIAHHKQKTYLNYNEILQQAIANLIGPTPEPISLSGGIYDEKIMVPLHQEAKDKTALYVFYFHKMILSCFFESFDQAVKNADILSLYKDSATGLFLVPLRLYYEAIARLAVLPDPSSRNRNRYLKRVRRIQKKLENWAKNAPMNHNHRFLLVEAEMARVMGEDTRAEDLYDQAIFHARENGFIQDEALSMERFAAFWTARNKPDIARFYLEKAFQEYRHWGAFQKLRALQKKYPEIARFKEDFPIAATDRNRSAETCRTLTDILDIDSVLKASQAISSEIALKRMLENLMRIVIENAGAQKGILFLEKKGKMVIEAEGTLDQIRVMPSTPLDPTDTGHGFPFPETIIRLVARTRTPLVLDQTFHDPRFSKDPYVISHELKSVLCMPVIRHGELTGVLYLENNLAAFAFTQDRFELLKLLASQAAISIENARLYGTLEEKVVERTRELALAQNKIVRLEKESTEIQMAGGFAHEMRNALAGAKKLLGKAFDVHRGVSQSLCYQNSQTLTDIYRIMETSLDPGRLKEMVEMIERINENEATLDEILTRFRDRMDRALSIVDEIMEYSRLGRSHPGNDPVSLGSIIEAMIRDELKEELEEADIRINLAIQGKKKLQGNERHFHSIIKNIVLNARDAMIPLADPKRKRIDICLTDQSDSQTLSIEDYGVGIGDEDQKKMFDPFFTTKPHSGKGLGLGVVSKLTGLYNGTIQVKSEPGQGTKITICFPFSTLKE